jgi:hypothetical protein
MNSGGKTYSVGNSGHEPPPGFLFTNSTGKGREGCEMSVGYRALRCSPLRGLGAEPGGYSTCASLPRAATGGAGAHRFAPPLFHIHRSAT